MRQGLRRTVQFSVVVVAAMAAMAPVAWASINPTLALDQSGGTAAGSTANLGLDLKFAPTGTDSPDAMTLALPPGLLANASINGGACLKTADLTDSACEVGNGTVTALAYGTIPVTTPVTFDLVPPPAAGDLAGLAVNSSGTQIGSTAEIRVRPSGDPAGVGVTINFVLPNSLFGVPISVSEINSTFDGLRYPTSCPSTPQRLTVSVNSYGDPSVHTVSAPLTVTGCSSLSFSPVFSVTAARDSGDQQVKLTTVISQAATEAPSKSVTLAFPVTVLQPNVVSVALLCPNLSSGHCTPVGSVTATSPLYPKPLSGQAYLTGSMTGLMLTLTFPSPFPLTLTGTVDLVKNATVFNGLPDIPLTGLNVTLNSGANGLFLAPCAFPSGTATATLTNQNGDKTVNAPARFTVSGCPAGGAGGGSGGGNGGGNGSSGGGATGGVKITPSFSGLTSGHASLTFGVSVGKRAAKLRALTVELPGGLSFAARRAGGRLRLSGVALTGAAVKSLTLSNGHLVIRLQSAVRRLTVRLGPAALKESAALKARAKAKRLHSLVLTVITENTHGKHTAIHVRTSKLGL